MKKTFIIILLSYLQSACSSQPLHLGNDHTLLSYCELATEITVGYEEIVARPVTESVRNDSSGSP